MEEKTLFVVSLVIAVLGLLFLFFYAEEVDIRSVGQLDTALPQEQVLVQGIVTRMGGNDKVLFLEIAGERVENIEVIVFKEEDIYLQEGDYVEITGTVEEYQGKKEVVASTVVKK